MNEAIRPVISVEGAIYYDYSDFLGVPSGVILRNDNLDAEGIDAAIIKNVNFRAARRDVSLIKLNQKHTNWVIPAAENFDQPADGVFTQSEKHLLTIRTADCFPVLLYDGKTAAAIHLGWRSALSGILDNFFFQVTDFNYKEARAVIGPGIGACCFEVSEEVALLFNDKYRRLRNNRYFIDLKGFILDELRRFGVQYLLDKGACTACNSRYFYSYRREGSTVKQMLSYVYPRRLQ